MTLFYLFPDKIDVIPEVVDSHTGEAPPPTTFSCVYSNLSSNQQPSELPKRLPNKLPKRLPKINFFIDKVLYFAYFLMWLTPPPAITVITIKVYFFRYIYVIPKPAVHYRDHVQKTLSTANILLICAILLHR